MDLRSKFPLPLPDLWMACLEPEEIAYTISFTVAVPDKRKGESPLDHKILENIETNKIEIDSDNNSHSGYYCYGVPQIELPADSPYAFPADQKSIYFEAEAYINERGSYRSGGYMEPDEYPEVVLRSIEIIGISAFDGKQEKTVESDEFGTYPDFTYTDFINSLEEIVENTTSPVDDTDVSVKNIPAFPSSIVKKVEKYTQSPEFITSLIQFMEVISPAELEKAIKVFNLDMTKYRGRIAGMKFGL